MECLEEKKKLMEVLGLHWERRLQMTPLAARIQALLVLSPDEALSFDDITKITEASKSSVSSNLNLLLKMKGVEYFTVPGDRKRYFKASKEHMAIRLKEGLEDIKEEIEILNQIESFKSTYCKAPCEQNKSLTTLYQKFLNQQEQSLTEMLEVMEENLK